MKKGFTLAEVLITLGIIGIVAAMTLSIITSKYEKYIIEIELQKTYSELEKWFRIAENDFGPFDSWDWSLDANAIVEKYMAPYMKLYPCGKYGQNSSSYCMVPNGAFTTWYKPTETKMHGELETTGQYMPKYALPDGKIFGITTSYYSDWPTPGKSLIIFADVNGSRGRTIMGQDIFVFSICNFRGIKNRIKVGNPESVDNQSTDFLIKNCITSGVWQGAECTHLLYRNGWKFPKDYPIKF